MLVKSVAALLAVLVMVVEGRREGSGGFHILSDDSDFEMEGSGNDLDTLLLLPDDDDDDDTRESENSYDIHFGRDYDDDLNEYIYEDYYDDDDLTLKVDEDDSVLKLAEDNFADIEIKPKPEKEFGLETSQILIMVGSAFVSFGVAMLTFFLCKRSMEKRREKLLAINAMKSKEHEPSPIVKNYQRVPTDTQEYLENQDTHIEMYRAEQEAMQQNDPLIK